MESWSLMLLDFQQLWVSVLTSNIFFPYAFVSWLGPNTRNHSLSWLNASEITSGKLIWDNHHSEPKPAFRRFVHFVLRTHITTFFLRQPPVKSLIPHMHYSDQDLNYSLCVSSVTWKQNVYQISFSFFWFNVFHFSNGLAAHTVK